MYATSAVKIKPVFPENNRIMYERWLAGSNSFDPNRSDMFQESGRHLHGHQRGGYQAPR